MKKRFRSVRLRDLSAFSKSCLRYCISYGLLRASHSCNPTSIRTSVPLTRHFVLILVAFEIASGLLRALRVRRVLLRFRRAYTVKN